MPLGPEAPTPEGIEDWLVDPVRTCRECGCTDDHACDGGCSWVADDLCSACARAGVLDVVGRMNTVMLGVKYFVNLEPVQDLIDNIERTHAIGPFMDPTAYRDGLDNLRWQTEVLRAVAEFQKALKPIGEMIERAKARD